MFLKLRLAILGLFLVHGLVVSTWASRLPSIQIKLGISTGSLGLVLLASAVGALLSMPIGNRLMHRFGSKAVCLYSSLFFCLTLPFLALSTQASGLVVTLFFYGFSAGTMDVAMNAQAIHLEQKVQKSIMNTFHAFFSMGGLLGALIGSMVAAQGIPPLIHFSVAAVLYVILVLIAAPFLVKDEGLNEEKSPIFAPFSWQLAALCLIGFCCFLSEGAIIDWGGIYLYRILHATESRAALGYAFFSVAMTASRLVGDAITNRLGHGRLVFLCALLSCVGLATILVSTEIPYALFGFLVVGIGFSVIVPLVFGASGQIPGNSRTNLTTVSLFSFSAFLLGPTLIGLLAEAHGLRFALSILIGLMLIAAFFSKEGFKRSQSST